MDTKLMNERIYERLTDCRSANKLSVLKCNVFLEITDQFVYPVRQQYGQTPQKSINMKPFLQFISFIIWKFIDFVESHNYGQL
jgi:hypothetical protein